MALLDSHLDQIATSAKAIGDLEFPPPKAFTNALLGHHEITTLIRDTEPHEKSLFTVDTVASDGNVTHTSRRTTLFGAESQNRRKTMSQLQQRQGSAVAKVLGNDMLRQIQQSSGSHGRSRGVNVEVLLRGAEKLCSVYPVTGAKDRISTLRRRYAQVAASVKQYESEVSNQQARVNRANSNTHNDWLGEDDETVSIERQIAPPLTDEDLLAEEKEIKELEARKKALEERVAGIEKDLAGLLP